jgi:hypothetical protein
MLAFQVNEKRPESYAVRPPIEMERLKNDTTVLPALFAEMRRRGVILDATVHTFFEADLTKKPDAPSRGPIGAQITAAAYQAGVAISSGTDFVPAGDDPYPGLQTEMEDLVAKAGLAPADVIRAATSIAARALKLDDQMGTLAPGKLANLVIVSGNPLDGIGAFRSVVLTIKRGHAYPGPITGSLTPSSSARISEPHEDDLRRPPARPAAIHRLGRICRRGICPRGRDQVARTTIGPPSRSARHQCARRPGKPESRGR